MLFEMIRKLKGTLSIKLSFWYAVIFSLTSLLILTIFYQRISVITMKNIDQELTEELEELSSFYAENDYDSLIQELQTEIEFEKSDDIFFRLFASDGKVLFTSNIQAFGKIEAPDDVFDGKYKIERFEIRTISTPNQSFPIRTILGVVGTSEILQIGISLKESRAYLQIFKRLILWLMIPLFVLAACIGFFMSRAAIRGVEDVTQAAIEITEGKYDKRVETKTKASEIQRLKQTFNMMIDRLQGLLISMREMTDNIAHDLRSPLTRIRGIAEMTLLGKSSKSQYEKMAANTIEECDNLIAMINTMLDISEAEAGVADVRVEEIDLCGLIVNACELFRPIANEKQIRINTNLPEGLKLNGDKNKLQRIVTNLLENAIKYTPRDGDVVISVVARKNLVDIIVKDNGIGISENDLPHIFDRFYRGDKSRSQTGIGLGLSQVKAFVEFLKGNICVTSTPNKGSIFTVSMPY